MSRARLAGHVTAFSSCEDFFFSFLFSFDPGEITFVTSYTLIKYIHIRHIIISLRERGEIEGGEGGV